MALLVSLIALVVAGVDASSPAPACVDICRNVTDPVVCAKHGRCGKGVPGDFDYFVFSQLYLPQYCASLARGVDPTISHPPGTKCVSKPRRALSIHGARERARRRSALVAFTESQLAARAGLWPNYYDGFPFCCNKTSGTLCAARLAPPLVDDMQREWRDPASVDAAHTVAGLWNHEYQKHGSCFAASVGDAAAFVRAVLALDARLAPQSAAVDAFRGRGPVDVAALAAVYSSAVQLVCDGTAPAAHREPLLLELRTCFNVTTNGFDRERGCARPSDPNRKRALSSLPGAQIDCPTLTSGSANAFACNGTGVFGCVCVLLLFFQHKARDQSDVGVTTAAARSFLAFRVPRHRRDEHDLVGLVQRHVVGWPSVERESMNGGRRRCVLSRT